MLDRPTLMVMERGAEGFAVIHKGAEPIDMAVLDLTLSRLEGCYQELRTGTAVAIERRGDGRKYVTRWGSWSRGGLAVNPRDALFFVRDPFPLCQP